MIEESGHICDLDEDELDFPDGGDLDEEISVRFELRLTEDLLDRLQTEASSRDMTPDDLIAEILLDNLG